MSFFLLTFKRQGTDQPGVDRFEDAAQAMETFVSAERHYREQGDNYGVVLLIADDEETLRQTHAHYFADVDDMLSTFRDHRI